MSLPERSWLEHLPLPAVIIRAQRFVYANRAFLELLQLTTEEAVGMRFDERVAREDLQRVRERHAERLTGGSPPDAYELEVVRTDGTRLHVEIFVSQLGEETLFQLRDITDRQRRLEHLAALGRLGTSIQGQLDEAQVFFALQEGVEPIGATAIRLRLEGDRVIAHSAQGERLFETRRGESPNLTRAWEHGFAFIDDLKAAAVQWPDAEIRERVQRYLEANPRMSAALVRLEAPMQPRELLMLMAPWLRPVDEVTLRLFGSQVAAAINASRVVSDLAQRNAQLDALQRVAAAAGGAGSLPELFERAGREAAQVLRCSHVAIYLLEREGTEAVLVYSYGGSDEANRLYTRVPMAGTRLQKVVDAAAPRRWTTADYPAPLREVLERMGQRAIASVPMLSRSRSLGIINVAWREERATTDDELSMMMGLGVHLASAVESNRLIDDLRRSYEELSHAQDQLIRRERLAALGEMAAAVAHEVRNPLAVVFNALSTLRKEAPHAPLLDIISEESERIDHLVGDLLDFARPMTPVLTSEVSLATLVDDAVRSVLGTTDGRVGFALLDEGAPDPVAMDTRPMRQVFINLTTNAVQAMPEGGRLTVTLGSAPGNPRRARVRFHDTGRGIAGEVLPRIFEPFFTTRARGTGLGLALVKRIIESHRGTVTAESRPGSTTLELEWPAS